jgi:hypothetical protein
MIGLKYFIKGRLYLSLTNKCNSNTSIFVRGPSFRWGQEFTKLSSDPSADDIYNAVHEAFNTGEIKVDSMEAETITFAGGGV